MTLQGNESYVNLKNFRAVASNFAQPVSYMTDSIDRLFRIDVTTDYSGAPARAKRAWDRAPYSWNMVNLFAFGCHVIDRAYVRTYVHTYARVYRLYGWGRGGYQKEGRGVSGASWQVHIFILV